MRMKRTALAISSLAAATLVACQFLVGVENDDGVVRPDASAQEAGAQDAGSEAAPPCLPRKPPKGPTGDTNGETGSGTFRIFAFRKLVLTPRGPDEKKVIGYDLDDRCTGLPTTMNEAPCRGPAKALGITDEDGGVDNSFRTLFNSFVSGDPTDSGDPGAEFFNFRIRNGLQTFLLAVKDYNGLRDDREVNVGLVSSAALEGASDAGPQWNGQDRWTYPPETPVVSLLPKTPFKGYVVGWTLVVEPDVLPLAFGVSLITLHDAVITAKIDTTLTPSAITEGTIAGRAVATELFNAIGQFPTPDGKPLCSTSLRDGFQMSVCALRDIPARHKDDGPSALCDAVSVGLGFEGVTAVFGKEAGASLPQGKCEPGLTCGDD